MRKLSIILTFACICALALPQEVVTAMRNKVSGGGGSTHTFSLSTSNQTANLTPAGTTYTFSMTAAPTAGQTVAIECGQNAQSGTISVADGASNSYTVSTLYAGSGSNAVFLAVLPSAPSGASSSITVTTTGSFGGYSGCAYQIFSVTGSGAVVIDNTFVYGNGATPLTSPTVPVSGTSDLLVSTALSGGIPTANSPWTQDYGFYYSEARAAYILNASSSTAVNFSYTGANLYAIGVSLK